MPCSSLICFYHQLLPPGFRLRTPREQTLASHLAGSKWLWIQMWFPTPGPTAARSGISGKFLHLKLSLGSAICKTTFKEQLGKESFSRIWFLATPWTVAYQAPPSMGFSRQEYWSELPFPSPGELPDPGIKPISLASPALQADSSTSELQGSPRK